MSTPTFICLLLLSQLCSPPKPLRVREQAPHIGPGTSWTVWGKLPQRDCTRAQPVEDWRGICAFPPAGALPRLRPTGHFISLHKQTQSQSHSHTLVWGMLSFSLAHTRSHDRLRVCLVASQRHNNMECVMVTTGIHFCSGDSLPEDGSGSPEYLWCLGARHWVPGGAHSLLSPSHSAPGGA